jgi:hypothetical protein
VLCCDEFYAAKLCLSSAHNGTQLHHKWLSYPINTEITVCRPLFGKPNITSRDTVTAPPVAIKESNVNAARGIGPGGCLLRSRSVLELPDRLPDTTAGDGKRDPGLAVGAAKSEGTGHSKPEANRMHPLSTLRQYCALLQTRTACFFRQLTTQAGTGNGHLVRNGVQGTIRSPNCFVLMK